MMPDIKAILAACGKNKIVSMLIVVCMFAGFCVWLKQDLRAI